MGVGLFQSFEDVKKNRSNEEEGILPPDSTREFCRISSSLGQQPASLPYN